LPAKNAFTLIELVVVLAVVGLLLSIALPRFAASVDRTKEAVLRQNLAAMRGAIEQYRADIGSRPRSLEDLVVRRYLRDIPIDPLTDTRSTWIVVAPPDDAQDAGVFDVRSGAIGAGSDGTPYKDW
jgi:general secretion pathway protein G